MGERRGGEDFGEGVRPVEPEDARASGNDPGAVRIHRRGDADAGGRNTTERRDDAGREETGGRAEHEGTERRAEPEEVGTRSGDQEASDGGDEVEGMGRSDKVLISVLAALGVVASAVIFVLTLLRSPEWMQFALALVLFGALGLGAYRYVITPSGRRQEGRSE